MIRVRYRWRGHRAALRPGWREKILPTRAAEIEALTLRLAGHDVQTEPVRPRQLPLFGAP